MATNIITLGIGPSATIEYFLLLGLEAPAAAVAPSWRTYTPPDEVWLYVPGGPGRSHTEPDPGRVYTPPERG